VSREPGYDLAKDFVGVSPLTRAPFLLLTAPSQPDKNLPQLLARAKQNPGTVRYGSAGNGSTTHLAAAMFASQAKVDLQYVPYKGNSAAWPDLVAGRVGLLMEPYSTAASMIKAGQLKALGNTGTKRLDVLPDVATIPEQGVPSYSFYLWMGLLAPAETPKDAVQKLSEAARVALASPELKKRFRDEGSEPMAMSPEEFTRFLGNEALSYGKLVSDLALPKE
jgi:tripartite-type tricarboxylate transporter receptor subunit TctC